MPTGKEIELRRKIVSKIIFEVLTEKKTVLKALKTFPPIEGDKSLEAVWHALMHYESDEEIRKLDNEYAEAQFDFLEQVAFELQKGNDLPANIIDDYKSFYSDLPVPKKHGWFDLWGIFDKYINMP